MCPAWCGNGLRRIARERILFFPRFTSQLLFVHKVLEVKIQTLFGGIALQIASSTRLLFYSTKKCCQRSILLKNWLSQHPTWSDLATHNNTLCGELVNCNSLPVSSMGRPPGETCFFRLKRNDQVEHIFCSTAATSSQESTWIWYAHRQPSKKLIPFFRRLRRHLQKVLTVGTKLLVIFGAPWELHEEFHVCSIFVLPSLITNNPPSKTSARWTCLRTWQIWTTLVLTRTSKQASHVNRTQAPCSLAPPQWFNPRAWQKGTCPTIFGAKNWHSGRSVFTLTPPLGFPNLSLKPTTKKALGKKHVAVYHPCEMSLIQER